MYSCHGSDGASVECVFSPCDQQIADAEPDAEPDAE
eukprot:SAG31_NODE_50766_length_107_cov_90.250000_1_plen_35_part_11